MVLTSKLASFTKIYFFKMVLMLMSEPANIIDIIEMFMTWKWYQHTNWNQLTYISQGNVVHFCKLIHNTQ